MNRWKAQSVLIFGQEVPVPLVLGAISFGFILFLLRFVFTYGNLIYDGHSFALQFSAHAKRYEKSKVIFEKMLASFELFESSRK